jgi:peptidoglycan/xylan/chitin deacetylase (PgdA/CDA1 family)
MLAFAEARPLDAQNRSSDESPLITTARRGAKALAETVLPSSVVVWRAAEARGKRWNPLKQAVFGARSTPVKPGKIALTFDDGPTPLTLEYLNVLEQLGVRATFFLVGGLCAEHPELVQAIADRGHELAGHGYTHRRFTALKDTELREELWRTRALLPPTASSRALVRPPHGAVSLSTLFACARQGFTTVLWSLNSGDWCSQNAAEVEQAFLGQTATAGEIVLLHEGQSWTMQALPAIVGALEKAGHELVTVGELLA